MPLRWSMANPKRVRLEAPCCLYTGMILVAENVWICLTMYRHDSDTTRNERLLSGSNRTLSSCREYAFQTLPSLIFIGKCRLDQNMKASVNSVHVIPGSSAGRGVSGHGHLISLQNCHTRRVIFGPQVLDQKTTRCGSGE